jgi:hypothetical protein
MLSVKEKAVSLIERLPPDCSLEDIQYHLYVLGKVRGGLGATESDGGVEQDEAEARLTKWLID